MLKNENRMRPKDYVVRPYTRGDEEEIVHLLQLAMDGWPHYDLKCNPLDHWKWKHQENPLKKSIISLGIYDGKIIGCAHIVPLRLKIRDRVYLWGDGVDVAVHPDFRRIGVYTKTHKQRLEIARARGINFACALTANPILIKTLRARGYHPFPHSITNLVRIQDIDKHLRTAPIGKLWLKKFGFHAVKLLNNIRNNLISSKLSRQDLHISEIRSFDDKINIFWKQVTEHYSFIMERSREYLNWRYCDLRGGDYVIKQAEEDGKILGYIVLRIKRYRKEYPVGYIVDLLTLPDHNDTADALVEDAVQYFDDQGINIIRFWAVKKHSYERVLNRHGFLDSRVKVHLTYKPLRKGVELDKLRTTPADRLHFTYGDADWI